MGETFAANPAPRQSSPQQSRSPGRGLLLGMKKPVLFIVVLVVIATGVYSLFGWLELPNLNGQVKKLKTQVDALNREIDELSNQVDILQSENDRFGSSNDELNRTIDQFDEITVDLNSTAKQLVGVSGRLNVTNEELRMELVRLENATSVLSSLDADLQNQTDQLNIETDELDRTVDEFRGIAVGLEVKVNDLTKNSNQLTALNTGLTADVARVTDLNANLTSTGARFTELNANLTVTTNQLEQEVLRINTVLDDLNANRTELQNATTRLENETQNLETITSEQNQEVNRLNGTINNFTAQNTVLQRNIDKIMNATGILNSTVFDSTLAFANAASALARQIVASDALELAEDVQNVLELEETSLRNIELWDCAYHKDFSDEGPDPDWTSNFSLPIVGTIGFDEVKTYIGGTPFFKGLCLNTANFVEFLDAKYPDISLTSNLTSDLLFNGVHEYAKLALVHYFPKANECGLSTTAWTTAGNSCVELNEMLSEKYLWNAGTGNNFCAQ